MKRADNSGGLYMSERMCGMVERRPFITTERMQNMFGGYEWN